MRGWARVPALVALLAAGCFGPDIADDAIACGVGSLCPPGFVCDPLSNTCRREIGGGDGDGDGDGDASPNPDGIPACPGDYNDGGDGCYKLYDTPASWRDAELQCESDGFGVHLVVIDNVAEHFAIHSLTVGSGEVWVGYSDLAVEGELAWVSAGTFEPENQSCFFEPSPNNSDDADCVVQDENTCGDWFLRDCSELRPYVCEFDGNPAMAP